jgi:hypothetical protein
MTYDEFLRQAFVALEVNEAFTEAVLRLRDESQLGFCHRVGARWAKAMDVHGAENEQTLAAAVLSQVALFRLNAKHLEVHFADGSRWEARFRDANKKP